LPTEQILRVWTFRDPNRYGLKWQISSEQRPDLKINRREFFITTVFDSNYEFVFVAMNYKLRAKPITFIK
jgi:hypothetical protein